MFVGVDFPSFFDGDNFTLRRTTGHNMHDPESFITGGELEAGYSYENSRRNWRDYNHYVSAVIGDLTPEQIAETAPRKLFVKSNVKPVPVTYAWLGSEVADSEDDAL